MMYTHIYIYIHIMYVCIQNYSHPEVDYGLFNHIANLELFFSNIHTLSTPGWLLYTLFITLEIIVILCLSHYKLLLYSIYHTRNTVFIIYISIRKHMVLRGNNVASKLDIAIGDGMDDPYFCWHPMVNLETIGAIFFSHGPVEIVNVSQIKKCWIFP